jgi:cell division protein FtsI (penicillin-binding protein 3)
MSIKKDITWRFGIVYVMMLLLGIAIFGRAAYLQIFDSEHWLAEAKQNSIQSKVVVPDRGDILDCSGKILASSIPFYDVRLDLSKRTVLEKDFKKNIDSLSICLSKFFGDKSAEQYKKELKKARKAESTSFLIKNNMSYEELCQIKKFPLFRLKKPRNGLAITEKGKRVYPFGELAFRTLGSLKSVELGRFIGIEGSFNNDLTGVQGLCIKQRVAGNTWIPIDDENQVDPKDGYDVITTLDIDLQDVASRTLNNQLIKYKADHGVCIVMEVSTGDIKAMVNLSHTSDGSYHEVMNYAISESSEPGSTFKLPVLMACFEDGLLTLKDSVNSFGGRMVYKGKPIVDSHEGDPRYYTVKQAFEISSNVACAQFALRCYEKNPQKFIDRLYGFNLNKKLELQISGEGEPYINYPTGKHWSKISLPQIAYGYEVKQTPLQILTFYNAVANDGKMMKPRFVKELRYHGTTVKTFEPEVVNPAICSPSTIKMAKQMCEGVVKVGTAKSFRSSPCQIAGKTGTAQIARGSKGYTSGGEKSYKASFVGYFPAESPKYSCIVVVTDPCKDSAYYGGVVAGPVVLEIAEMVNARYFKLDQNLITGADKLTVPYAPEVKGGASKDVYHVLKNLGIPYVDNNDYFSPWISLNCDSVGIKIVNKDINKSKVPDVKGLSAKDALFLLENAGLKVQMNGYGWVESQSIAPGQRVKKGDRIVISMKAS